MDDHISRIEAALEAGPTLADWEVLEDSRHIYSKTLVNDGEEQWRPLIATTCDDETLINFEANAAFIAACNPVAIRALLDRLKAAELRAEHWQSEHAMKNTEAEHFRNRLKAAEKRVVVLTAALEEAELVLNESGFDFTAGRCRAALENTNAR